MGFLNNLFGAKETRLTSYSDFWAWFVANSVEFHQIVKTKDAATIETKLFGRLAPKLDQLKDGIFYLVGMNDESTADLVFTADGNAKNILFVEELVDAAPEIAGWQFTKLKQPMDIAVFGLTMNGNKFDRESLAFCPTSHESKPDLVDITLVHQAFEDASNNSAKNGALIFLENYLGELNFLTNIDAVSFCGPSSAEKDGIPIEALANYLETREALFVEKYHGVRVFTENDSYSLMKADLEDGRPLVATINTDLLGWDKKASHPWMLVVSLAYDGEKTNGLPDSETADDLNNIEHAISAELTDADGYLNIGRQSANDRRDIFYACAEFRKPSKVVFEAQKRCERSLDYEIFKDKYWQTVSHFESSADD